MFNQRFSKTNLRSFKPITEIQMENSRPENISEGKRKLTFSNFYLGKRGSQSQEVLRSNDSSASEGNHRQLIIETDAREALKTDNNTPTKGMKFQLQIPYLSIPGNIPNSKIKIANKRTLQRRQKTYADTLEKFKKKQTEKGLTETLCQEVENKSNQSQTVDNNLMAEIASLKLRTMNLQELVDAQVATIKQLNQQNHEYQQLLQSQYLELKSKAKIDKKYTMSNSQSKKGHKRFERLYLQQGIEDTLRIVEEKLQSVQCLLADVLNNWTLPEIKNSTSQRNLHQGLEIWKLLVSSIISEINLTIKQYQA